MPVPCDHPPCTCRRDPTEMIEVDGRRYCSRACESQPETAAGCGCAHTECRAP